jgi:ribosomal protein L11 methylase PrmA
MSVDIDEDTLIAARKNSIINGVQDIMDVVHTRIVYVGEIRFPVSDITVANILPGIY